MSSRRSVTYMVGGLVVSAALLASCGSAPARDVSTVPVPYVTSPTAQPWEVQQ